MNTHVLKGFCVIPKEKFYTEFPDDAAHRISFGIRANENNSAFVSLYGAMQDSIKVASKDKPTERIEIQWKDRKNSKFINLVAPFTKYRTNVGCNEREVKEFITAYDMVEYLKDELPKLSENDCIRVTGRMRRNPYNGDVTTNFDVQNVWKHTVKENDPKTHLGFNLQLELTYDANALDTTDDDVYYLNAYTLEYINKQEGNRYVPIILQFDKKEFNPSNNERHAKILESRLNYLRDKVGDTYVEMGWDVTYIRGAEEVPFDESMLTDAQREQIELGDKTIDDFKSKVYGTNVEIFKLDKPNTSAKKFKEGLVNTGLTEEEFESKKAFVDKHYEETTKEEDEEINDILN